MALTDIFARRYEDYPLITNYTEGERRFLFQAWTICRRDVLPLERGPGALREANQGYERAHTLLAHELGIPHLADPIGNSGNAFREFQRSYDQLCELFLTQGPSRGSGADIHFKIQLSLVELLFRTRWQQIEANRQSLAQRAVRQHWSGDRFTVETQNADEVQSWYQEGVDELNQRFRLERFPLEYHNGYVQVSEDGRIRAEIETPFWGTVARAPWETLSAEMAEAVDARDNGRRDAAFRAVCALESAMKVVARNRNWTKAKEPTGVGSWMRLLGEAHTGPFYADWECTVLNQLIQQARNPFGHGAGQDPVPELPAEQTRWAIESCMSWIKLTIARFEALP